METEWIDLISSLMYLFSYGEYLTYKEWKRNCFHKIFENVQCEYLTYKEWKHEMSEIELVRLLFPVSTLPIRNGNNSPSCILLQPVISDLNVSTLPIRNGNENGAFCRLKCSIL